jgi:hypothetical protein
MIRTCSVCEIELNDDNESDEFPGYCNFCVENNHIYEEDLPQT